MTIEYETKCSDMWDALGLDCRMKKNAENLDNDVSQATTPWSFTTKVKETVIWVFKKER